MTDVIEGEMRLMTTCALTVYADDIAVWPVQGDDEASLEIQIDDLLAHLVEYWKPLVLRQTYPFGLNPKRPSDLGYKARRRWDDLPEEQVTAEDEELETFLDCHEISRCFAGYFDLPPLWIIRSGDHMLVEASGGVVSVPFDAAIASLVAAGDQIAERLAEGGERWSDLANAWKARDDGEGLVFLSWATSLDQKLAQSLADDGLLEAPQSLADAANDNDELRLAARMASALPPEQVRTVLQLVAGFPKVEAPRLVALAAASRSYFDETLVAARPFEQGEGLADFVREQLSLKSNEAVDIFSIVEQLGVDTHVQAVEPRSLDALAVYGRKHGPAILLNTEAIDRKFEIAFKDAGRARVTLAHELCHLLIDGGNALSAVDVLGGLMPLSIEQRARAFGAQLLLPSSVAANVWIDMGRPRSRAGLVETLDQLSQLYTVTHSVAAWKLEHGARAHGENLEAMLRSIVPNR
ncbi:ImmA/IrrE family metallo-endopeptidase [Caulobacter segnis]|uniref:ImmA/IrrE family metallo-endopeptidase n=1 Tax=Caulobacter segnis TaxID=88688 RepID=UPI001CBB99BD|nr:ImmA/IrrE family metallo-endopeptidase [Caulobacter segnis]UAL11680.1 ImmA/IrrE family metallo-endopeptidase [Caulobacter segnis]